MHLAHDARADDRLSSVLPVVDQLNRQSLVPDVSLSTSCQTAGAVSVRVLKRSPGPRSITVDHGTKFQSRALEDSVCRRDVQLLFTPPPKPVENNFIKAFDGRLLVAS